MIQTAIDRLSYLVQTIPPVLEQLGEDVLSEKPSPEKWSKKEIIGHLIDSATNNHQRFVRGQFETNPEISYDQNQWNRYNFYQEIDSQLLIHFWVVYHQHLIEICKRIPEGALQRNVRVGDQLLTLEFLINDYVTHLEHHLRQLTDSTLAR